MNIIFTYKKNSEFSKEISKKVNEIKFSKVPEMRTIDGNVPFQADIKESEFDNLYELLSINGVVDIIGKWNNNGTKIVLDNSKYCNLLNDIEVFEDAIFYDGIDYTNEEYLPSYLLGKNQDFILDNDGNPKEYKPVIKRFKRVKTSNRPTLLESKEIQVNAFNKSLIREL